MHSCAVETRCLPELDWEWLCHVGLPTMLLWLAYGKEDGPKAWEERAPRPLTFEASALSAPMSNSSERNQLIKGGKKSVFCSPHYTLTPILSPNEIIAP